MSLHSLPQLRDLFALALNNFLFLNNHAEISSCGFGWIFFLNPYGFRARLCSKNIWISVFTDHWFLFAELVPPSSVYHCCFLSSFHSPPPSNAIAQKPSRAAACGRLLSELICFRILLSALLSGLRSGLPSDIAF
jgi:hypothetical protein